MKFTITLLLLIAGYPLVLNAQNSDYLKYVQQHYDNLIMYGKDDYGKVHTGMLASVIDTRDMSIPKSNVPATQGIRFQDRAVGGSNLYQDVETIKGLQALAKLTTDQKYQQAVDQYVRDFLNLSQNSYTGLLAWGEHAYYNFYMDTVMVGDIDNSRGTVYHEFLAESPPWQQLWGMDNDATKKAIAGILFHYRSPVTQSYLFNRHAYYNRVSKTEIPGEDQYQDGGQPWIKHSGLQCFSFSFLYSQTKDPEWKKWIEGSGNLYWKYRDEETNLVPSCIDDPRPASSRASITSMSILSYYLLKASQLNPEFEDLKTKAEIMLKAIEKYSWNPTQKNYHATINLDGSVYDSAFVPVVHTGYGSPGILEFGRIAAYFYENTNDPVYQEMVNRVKDLLLQEKWPENFVINSLAEALQFSLDGYSVTEDKVLFNKAKELADIGIENLWNGKMFVRQPGDPYYEAKVGTGAYLSGLIRLHLLDAKDKKIQDQIDWSF